MPDSQGNIKGISVPDVPWHRQTWWTDCRQCGARCRAIGPKRPVSCGACHLAELLTDGKT